MKSLAPPVMLSLLLLATLPLTADEGSASATFQSTGVKAQLTADIVTLRDTSGTERNVRLYGVACPVAGQLYAQAASDYVTTLIKDKALTVEVLAEDTAGLPVAWLRSGEGPTINEQLAQAGFAWWDEPNAPKANRLKRFAAQALIAGVGLWKDNAPLAPWDYRMSYSLPRVTYAVEPEEEMEESLESIETETPTLAAKGTAKPAPAAPPAPPMANLPQIAPEEYLGLAAKHQPRIARDGQGRPLGLTANDIAAIPGASQVGFKNGDIVQSVNGIALTNEAQLLGLVGQLQGAKSLTLKVIRDGKPVTITIPL